MQSVPEERAQALGGKRCSAGKAREARSKAQGLGRGLFAQINCSVNSGTSWTLSPFISVSATVNRSMEAQTFLVLSASYLKLKLKPDFLPQGHLQHTQMQPGNTRKFTA